MVKLSSRRIISDASFATSVPVRPIATPISAAFNAGESFTPSPVIAATSPFLFKDWIMRSLSAGDTLANTVACSTAWSSSSSLMADKSSPDITVSPFCQMESSFAMARAVTLWSPVIIMVRIPAFRQVRTDSATSFLGGSIIPATPIKVISNSIFSSSSSGRCFRVFTANPSTRKAFCDMESHIS